MSRRLGTRESAFSKLPITEFFEFADKNSLGAKLPFHFKVGGFEEEGVNTSDEGGDRSEKIGW
jgi:hypothetical protein